MRYEAVLHAAVSYVRFILRTSYTVSFFSLKRELREGEDWDRLYFAVSWRRRARRPGWLRADSLGTVYGVRSRGIQVRDTCNHFDAVRGVVAQPLPPRAARRGCGWRAMWKRFIMEVLHHGSASSCGVRRTQPRRAQLRRAMKRFQL